MEKSLVLLSFTIFLHSSSVKCKNMITTTTLPSLFVFGDSLLDNGNNNFLPTLARANFPPYGVDFIEGPTGRFTNGKTVADITAELLGLQFIPPYMSLRNSDNFTGLNYASGAGGILPDTGSNLGKCLPLGQQIDLFQKTVDEDLKPNFESNEDLQAYLSKAIFMVSIGTNDYINNYLQPVFFNTSQIYSPQEFAQFLIKRLSQLLEVLNRNSFKIQKMVRSSKITITISYTNILGQLCPHGIPDEYVLQRIYKLGAKKIIIFEVGPIGCMPTYANRGHCVDDYNKFVAHFNSQLSAMLKQSASLLSNSLFLHGKISTLVDDIIQNPPKYGLIDAKDPCCATVHGTLTCTPGLPACLNADQHLWWDGYHLTEAIYSIIAKDCFTGSSTCSPMGIRHLVQA